MDRSGSLGWKEAEVGGEEEESRRREARGGKPRRRGDERTLGTSFEKMDVFLETRPKDVPIKEEHFNLGQKEEKAVDPKGTDPGGRLGLVKQGPKGIRSSDHPVDPLFLGRKSQGRDIDRRRVRTGDSARVKRLKEPLEPLKIVGSVDPVFDETDQIQANRKIRLRVDLFFKKEIAAFEG